MALKEQDIVFTGKDSSGNTILQMPITRAANVEDLTSTCLALSGGNLTGNLTVQSKNVVRSVNGSTADATGNVTLSITHPVTSVNGKTGAVTITEGGTSAYQIPFATCSTAKSTAAKVATITNGASFSLVAGAIVAVKYSNNPSNTTQVGTLNVNSTGAKTIKEMQIWYGQESHNASMGAYHTNGVYLYIYDGTYWNEFVRMYRESDEGWG